MRQDPLVGADQQDEQNPGTMDFERDAEEFERLPQLSHGNSAGWKFNREEAHERR